ncbi:3-hydroxyacyl-ACP dehydratase FabZ family protein [Nocardiopsis oceani]
MIAISSGALPQELDRILHVEPGSHAIAAQSFPGSLDLFADHFPRFPVLPGLLLLDCMTEVMLLPLLGRGEWSVAAFRGLSLIHPVLPGDTVEVSADIVEERPDRVRAVAAAEVDARTVARVREVVLVPADAPLRTE